MTTDTKPTSEVPADETIALETDEAGTEQTPADEVKQDDQADEPTPRPEREAARYRRQLREAEAQRDALTARLAAVNTEVVRHAVESLRVRSSQQLRPEALADAVPDVAEYVGEDGQVDTKRLTAHLTKVQADRPHWFQTNLAGTMIIPGEGKDSGSLTKGTGFADAFSPRR